MTDKRTFRQFASQRGAWPPIHGTPIHEGIARLCDALVDYVDETTTPAPTPRHQPIKGEMMQKAVPRPDYSNGGLGDGSGGGTYTIQWRIWDGGKWIEDIDPFNPPRLPPDT